MPRTPEEHLKFHIEANKALEDLAVDYFMHTGNVPGYASVADLMDWSKRQAIKPSKRKNNEDT